MRYYTIVTDSSCDLPAPLLEKMGIRVVPLAVNLDGKTYFNYPDGRALALKNIMPSCGRANRPPPALSICPCSAR